MGPGKVTPRRVRLWVVVATSLVLALALMNLFLVAEQAPVVRPSEQDGVIWQTGTGAVERSGQHTWNFVVDPMDRRIVELDLILDYRVRVTHVEGEASLVHEVSFWADGDELHRDVAVITAAPRTNVTDGVSRTWSETGSFSPSLRIPREAGSPPFVLLVVWDWEVVSDVPARATFETNLRPFQAEAIDVGGIPGCGSVCARILVFVAIIVQVVAFGWFRQAPRAAPPMEPRRQNEPTKR